MKAHIKIDEAGFVKVEFDVDVVPTSKAEAEYLKAYQEAMAARIVRGIEKALYEKP